MINAVLWIFQSAWNGVKLVGKALALPFQEPAVTSRAQQIARWGLHAVCVFGILAGLTFLNYALGMDRYLLTPIPALRSLWLPALFLLVYGMSWLGWCLCMTLIVDRETGVFPAIKNAWRNAERSLVQVGIDLRSTPIYLVIGKSQGGAARFLEAAQLEHSVSTATNDESRPFHVIANHEAIFVCCENTSLLGRQAELFYAAKQLRQETAFAANGSKSQLNDFPAEPVVPADIAVEAMNGSDSTVQINQRQPAAEAQLTQTATPAVNDKMTTVLEQRPAVRHSDTDTIAYESLALVESNIALLEQHHPEGDLEGLSGNEAKPRYQPARKVVTPLLQEEDEIGTIGAQLSYLCQLLNEARHPYCPINGVVALIPFASSEDHRLANHTGMLIENDLQTITEATHMTAPRVAVLCDLEDAARLAELLGQFPAEQRHRRLGIRFPRIAACDGASMDPMISQGMRWLCHHLVPPLVNRLLQTERTGEPNVHRSNEQLYHFMYSIRQRRPHLERLIRRAFLGNRQPGELLRGCYFAATGRTGTSEQAFAAGIISQLADMQDECEWTQEALARDRECRRWTVFGYASVGVIASVGLLLILF